MIQFNSRHVRYMLSLMLSLSFWAQEGRSQATLTISSATTTAGWTYNSGDRTLTVNSTSIANATTILGYLNTGPLTIVGASPNLSVTLSSALNSTGGSANGLTIGAEGNTGTITLGGALTLKGAVTLRGANINVNSNINTTSGAATGDLLIKASGDIIIKGGISLTTTGGDAIFWANSDGQTANGGVTFKKGSSLTTGGGHIWIGGGSGTATWNGLTVGDGPAVSGRATGDDTYDPSTPDNNDWQAGVIFNMVNISSGGGNIYVSGACKTTPPLSFNGSGIINYSGVSGTTINAGSGTIQLIGNNTSNGFGIMTGVHPTEYSGQFIVRSSNTASPNAIMVEGHAHPVDGADGILIENYSRFISSATTNGGGISVIGSSGSGGFGLNVDADSRLDALSASGGINVNSGASSMRVAFSGVGLYLGSISGDPNVAASTANVTLISDDPPGAGPVQVKTTGACTIKHQPGSCFTSPLDTWRYSFNGVTSLTIGDPDNVGSGVSIFSHQYPFPVRLPYMPVIN